MCLIIGSQALTLLDSLLLQRMLTHYHSRSRSVVQKSVSEHVLAFVGAKVCSLSQPCSSIVSVSSSSALRFSSFRCGQQGAALFNSTQHLLSAQVTARRQRSMQSRPLCFSYRQSAAVGGGARIWESFCGACSETGIEISTCGAVANGRFCCEQQIQCC